MITITKVEIKEELGFINAIFIHDETDDFKLFIDENRRLRTEVKEFIYASETPILKI